MNILADENVEQPIIVRLRAEGHQVIAIAETQPGIPDTEVLQQAVQAQLFLLTGDKDFGDLLFLQRRQAPQGVILVRLPDTLTSQQKATIVADVLRLHAPQLLGAFTVISQNGVRLTPLP
jgi:predicted nuclease of predicted toxin-antitoxin system